MSIHDVNLTAGYCDYIVMFQGARVQAAGPVETVLVPEVLEPAFGVRVERVPLIGGGPCTGSRAAPALQQRLSIRHQSKPAVCGTPLPNGKSVGQNVRQICEFPS